MSPYNNPKHDPMMIDMLSKIQSYVGLEDGEDRIDQEFTNLRIRMPPKIASEYAEKLESHMNQLEMSSDTFTPYFQVAIRRLRM